MIDPTVLFVKPRAISQRDKKALQNAGVIVVEIENLMDAKFIRAGVELSASDMLLAAVAAIQVSDFSVKAFGKAMCSAIEATKHE